MTNALWAALAVVAVLWPARLVGPLDGIPLDEPLEAVALGVVAVALVVFEPRALRHPAFRGLVVTLLVWKAVTGVLITQDGWCLTFTTPHPVYRDMGRVPHTWDMRVDWQSPEPKCSGLVSRAYPSIERFPVWFFNLPPADPLETPTQSDRPPFATPTLDVTGYLEAIRPGVLRIGLGEDMRAAGRVDDVTVSADDLSKGIPLDRGIHHVELSANLRGLRWRLVPTWNDVDLWQTGRATIVAPGELDRWIRPWGRFVAPILIALLLLVVGWPQVRRLNVPEATYAVVTSVLAFAVVATGRTTLIRAFPLLLASAALLKWPRALTNLIGLRWLIAMPFLALIVAIGIPQVGKVTWYSGGDDWWMFQRFAYRIFIQGYWLEGGTPTFWFQPLYRWIVGALHVVFGDSSVGEVFWDGACLLTGACFAFHITRRVAGFRWGIAAAVITLAVFTLGPGWYLIGRGLSEITSAGFIYGAALLALRGRAGARMAAVGAGVLATFGFYARLNNLPMMLAVAAFAWPVRQAASDLWKPSVLWPRASRAVLLGVFGAVAIGLWLFTMRTWYYTGVPSMLFGTQASALSVWQSTDDGRGPVENVIESVLMVLTMNDPPRFDLRSVPLIGGSLVAVLALMQVRPFRRLPLNAVILCVAGMSGALVARGTAYPGRFSIHLVPVTVALFVCAISLTRAGREAKAS